MDPRRPTSSLFTGGEGPQIGKVSCAGHPTYHVNVIKLAVFILEDALSVQTDNASLV